MEKSRHYAVLLLATICVTYFVENFLRSAAGALTPILIEELGISHGAMGLLISAYFFVYGLMQLPSGILSDTFGAKKTILGFTALTVVGIFLFWASRSYTFLFVAQFLVGIGCSTFYINAVKLVSIWFPPERKATAIGVLSASSGLGNFVSYMGFPIAMERLGGWRTLYFWMSVVLVVNWVMNLFIISEKNGLHASTHSARGSIMKSVSAVFRDRRMYPFLAGYILASTSWVFMNWMPQYLIDAKGFTYFEVGQIASVGTIAGIPGCILVAAVSDRLRRRKLPLMAFAVAYSGLFAVFLFLPAATPLIAYMALSFLMSFCVSFWVLFFSMIPETLPAETSAIGLGIMNGVGTIGFSVVAPLYGGLVDVTGGYMLSNLMILGGALAMPLIFGLFIKECYGKTPEE
ncbi:MFS transporter [Candidatus Bathyarchaeota archaeon]|nr:MFS transporter [Candidatus Bathyarchaeota archaeon]